MAIEADQSTHLRTAVAAVEVAMAHFRVSLSYEELEAIHAWAERVQEEWFEIIKYLEEQCLVVLDA